LAGSVDDEMKLLLAHNPIILRRAARRSRPRASAATRRRPGNLAAEKTVRDGRVAGCCVAWDGEEHAIYVTRGLGTFVLPIRYGCPPEVSVLELRSMS